MAKRKKSTGADDATSSGSTERTPLESAQDEIHNARQRLREAQQQYEEMLRETENKADGGQTPVQSAIAETLELVKKYPGPGIICAALAGFFLGRLFRR